MAFYILVWFLFWEKSAKIYALTVASGAWLIQV